MPPLSQARQHGDRNVVPTDDQSSNECPIDAANLAHMRAVEADTEN